MPSRRPYYCHQCLAVVTSVSEEEPLCSRCHGSFLEEMNTPDDSELRPEQPMSPDIFLARMMHMALHNINSSSNVHRINIVPIPQGSSSPHESLTGLPFFLQRIFTGMPGLDWNDFVLTQEQMDHIAEQLRQQHGHSSEKVLPEEFFQTGLPEVEIVEAQVAKGLDCVICQDKFALGEPDITRLGCLHLFHRACVLPWLKKHATCPTCRWDVFAEWQAVLDGRMAPVTVDTPGAWEPEMDPVD